MNKWSRAPASLDWERAAQLRDRAPATTGDLRGADRTLLTYGHYQIIYAPFDGSWNRDARVVLLGITPGIAQAQEANRITLEALREGGSIDWDALAERRRMRVAFLGTMRRNLVRMLDDVGLHWYLALPTTDALFQSNCGLAQMASALRYPVFRGDQNYSGGASIVRAPFFRDMLERLLAPELASVPDALVIPFGPSVERALEYLAQRGLFDGGRTVRGFPHPSGASPSRAAVFARNRDDIAAQLARWFSARLLHHG